MSVSRAFLIPGAAAVLAVAALLCRSGTATVRPTATRRDSSARGRSAAEVAVLAPSGVQPHAFAPARADARYRWPPRLVEAGWIQALERARQSPAGGDAQIQRIASLLAPWARTDPPAAWAWVAAHYRATPGPDGVSPVLALLQAVAAHDPRLVVSYADAVRQSGLDEAVLPVCAAAVTAMITTGHVPLACGVVEQWIAESGPRTVDAATVSQVTVALAERASPRSAADWLARIAGGADCGEATGMLASSWAETDPAGALAWAQSLRDTAGKSVATERAFAVWSDHDPDGASQWFLAHEADPASDELIPIFLQHSLLPYTSPAAAMQWANLVRDSATRARALAVALNRGE